VAELTRIELNRLARLGAKARLEELRQEEASIRRAFPDLFRGGSGKAASDGMPRRARKRGSMSPAARKAVSERMKKYWAERRKAKAARTK
jgi:hypothetical protein